MQLRLTALALVTALMLTVLGNASFAYADTIVDSGDTTWSTQKGGAAGLVAAVVQAQNFLNDANVEVVAVDVTFNNLIALNNVLNNLDITLNDVDVVDIDELDVDVQNVLTNFLNENAIDVGAVVGVLSTDTGYIVFY